MKKIPRRECLEENYSTVEVGAGTGPYRAVIQEDMERHESVFINRMNTNINKHEKLFLR
jgi:hypothetical protein